MKRSDNQLKLEPYAGFLITGPSGGGQYTATVAWLAALEIPFEETDEDGVTVLTTQDQRDALRIRIKKQ